MVESISHFLFNNPISQATFQVVQSSAKVLSGASSLLIPKQEPVTQIIKMDPDPLWKLAKNSGYFVRFAGVSGAAAVILGAYGAHSILPDKDKDEKLKTTFETANRYHFYHSIALLGVPLCRRPVLTGSLMILGISLFSGTCYYYALTGDNRLRRLTPMGGTCLILAWLSMIL